MEKRRTVVIIPALNPDERLNDYVAELVQKGFDRILLVDDGSREACKPIFRTLADRYGCDLLVHARNMGKGRALKDAFNHYLNHYAKEYIGVITADSDGQHRADDVVKLDEAMAAGGDALVLGVRDFGQADVPFKSRFGNRITRTVMKLLVGGSISDTQTGLRGIPNRLVAEYLTLFGERFEYETTMLIESVRKNIPIREVTIETVYIDGNRETHFNPLKDSIAIYRLILGSFLKYVAVSLSSFLIDYLLFLLVSALMRAASLDVRVWTATVVARVVSSAFNYMMNRSVVFRAKGNVKSTLVKYYILCVAQMCCSAALVALAGKAFGWPSAGVKPVVDLVLFFLSYHIQRLWVFREKD